MAVDGGRVAGLGASINDGELSVVATTLDDHAIGAHRERFARHAAPSAVLARLAQLLAALANQVREAGSEPIGVTVAQDGRWCAHLDPTELDRMLAGLSDSTGASGWPISSSLLPRSVATATAESRHANVGDHHAQDALVLMTGRDPRGLVLKNGRLVLGAQGLAGAVDHLPVGQGLLECDCGLSGCWKPVVSPVALGPAAARHDRSVVAKIRTRALAGDADAHAAIERVGYWLGVGSAVIAQFVRPEHIVIAGVYAPLGPFMRDALLAGLSSSTAGPALEDIDVTISSLGEGAAARGAALHAVEQVLTHPELTPYQPVQDTADL
jgi:predicted NBD/HSP70 family sugar kinase